MDNLTLLVQTNQIGKTKFIKITQKFNTVFREWGIVGGKIQKTSNVYEAINAGKINELTACQAAKADYHRIIEKKIKDGYVKTESLDILPDLLGLVEITLDDIPTGFCCSKPKKEIIEAELDALMVFGNARFFVKYNGLCHYILINSKSEVKIYTRRWDDHTRKYPTIVEAVQKRRFNPGTLLITELCIDPNLGLPHMEAFQLMSAISKSDTVKGKLKAEIPKTIAKQKEHQVKAAIFGILYHSGNKTWNRDYESMLNALEKTVPLLNEGKILFRPVEVFFKDTTEVFSYVKDNAMLVEGLVVWDQTQAMEVTMNGKPNRCAAWKIKAPNEMDIVANGYVEGNGDLQGKIGSLIIGLYDTKGNFHELGTVGSGLQPNKGDCDISAWVFPCVIEIKFSQIFSGTGAFQFPVFSKKHEDKEPLETELYENHIEQ